MQARNPKHAEGGAIDCEIQHPEFGWIPFTASPNDPEEFGRALHAELLQGAVADYQVPTVTLTREAVEAARLRAYADPLTGSDRYFAEANREALMGNQGAADAAKAAGVARFAEIQAAHPWPPEPAE